MLKDYDKHSEFLKGAILVVAWYLRVISDERIAEQALRIDRRFLGDHGVIGQLADATKSGKRQGKATVQKKKRRPH